MENTPSKIDAKESPSSTRYDESTINSNQLMSPMSENDNQSVTNVTTPNNNTTNSTDQVTESRVDISMETIYLLLTGKLNFILLIFKFII